MARTDIAYFGSEGTFSHLVAQKRFGKGPLMALPSVDEIFDFVKAGRTRLGVVPIENSSGGPIYETVDALIQSAGRIFIQEELSLNVRLALLGKKGTPIRTIYSHFAPFRHLIQWLKSAYPGVKLREVSSTAEAARLASREGGSAAIGSRSAAKIYGLQVLRFPLEENLTNVTQFFTIGQKPRPAGRPSKSSYVVYLADTAGSLCSFLEPFKDEEVNLTRITSRPIPGQPNRYVFFIDVRGSDTDPKVRRAIATAKRRSIKIERIGTFAVKGPYQS